MSLTGNLESFPLAEVLRLAARTRQSGLRRAEASADPTVELLNGPGATRTAGL